MTKYVASVNIPGYLPEGDSPVFDEPGAAWYYLADGRRRDEDDAVPPTDFDHDTYSRVVDNLTDRAAARAGDRLFGEGVVYGGRPGYGGEHDQGLAYVVSAVNDTEAAQIEALQD